MPVSGSLQRRLVHRASAPYRPAGPWAWRFARGKLGGDPLFAALLGPGLLPASGRYLDLGCTFVAVGVDVLMFANAARKLRGQFAGATAAAAPAKASAAY